MFNRNQVLKKINMVNLKLKKLKEGVLTVEDKKILNDCRYFLINHNSNFDFRHYREKRKLIEKIDDLLDASTVKEVEMEPVQLISLR